MSRTAPGLFVVFEGGEGAGKSTQLKKLAVWLQRNGHRVVVTREPGGSRLGQWIRKSVLDPRQGPVSPRAELLLYEADRAQHVDELILPTLASGGIVLSDRYADSCTVYQGMCRGLGVPWTKRLNDFATNGLKPDLVIILDVPVETGLGRIKARKGGPDRLEREAAAFHEKVRKGFLTLARADRRRFAVIDGTLDAAKISTRVRELVSARLDRKAAR